MYAARCFGGPLDGKHFASPSPWLEAVVQPEPIRWDDPGPFRFETVTYQSHRISIAWDGEQEQTTDVWVPAGESVQAVANEIAAVVTLCRLMSGWMTTPNRAEKLFWISAPFLERATHLNGMAIDFKTETDETKNLRIELDQWRRLALALSKGVEGDHLDPFMWRIYQSRADRFERRVDAMGSALALCGRALRSGEAAHKSEALAAIASVTDDSVDWSGWGSTT